MADSHAKQHDYHLVDPSPWPALSSIAAFATAIGAVMWMHDKGYAVFVIGFIVLCYTAFAWWRDVIKEGEHEGHHTPVVQLGLRYGMIMFIASEVMFFVAWFWAYFNAGLFPTEVGGGIWPPEGILTFNPAVVRHNGDLGSSCAPAWRSKGIGAGVAANRDPWCLLHCSPDI